MARTIKFLNPLRLECLEAREVPTALFALTNSQRLLTFDSANPSALLGAVSVSGLAIGEKLTDIDVRSANGVLYGRSDQGRLYAIDSATGAAAQVGGVMATGASVGMDFDPATDQLRVANFSGHNIAVLIGVNSSHGTVIAGGSLSYANGEDRGPTPRLSGLAFADGASSTRVFGIDHISDTLAVGMGDPNGGQFSTVGSLGVDTTNRVGFDIDYSLGAGFITVQPTNTSNSHFGEVNLNTGAVTLAGPVGSSAPLILDIAVAHPPMVRANVTPTTPNLSFAPNSFVPSTNVPLGLTQPIGASSFVYTGPTIPFGPDTGPPIYTGPTIPFGPDIIPPTGPTVPQGPDGGPPVYTGPTIPFGPDIIPPVFPGATPQFPTTDQIPFPGTIQPFPTK